SAVPNHAGAHAPPARDDPGSPIDGASCSLGAPARRSDRSVSRPVRRFTLRQTYLMASVPIKVPAVGESISEGIIAQWMLPDGAAVKKGDKLFELETDKATQVIEADRDGVLRIQAQPGTTVAIGATVGAIDTDATPSESTPSPAPAHSANTTPAPPASSHPPLSPAVRRIAEEEKLDLSRTEGTGPGGR